MTSVWPRLTAGLAFVGGLLAVCVGVGVLCGLGHADWVGLAALFGVLGVIAVTNQGLFLALMLLVVLDGVPGPELASNAAGSLKLQDVAVAAIFGLLVLSRPTPVTSPRIEAVRRATYVLSGLLIGWWIITVARSEVAGIPVSKAALFGRDFLYFALLLPLAVRARLTARDMRWLVGVLSAAMILYAFGNIATATGIAHISWLVHG